MNGNTPMAVDDVVAFRYAHCIGCNCHDLDACLDENDEPCSWLMVDRDRGVGVCSECPDYQEQFQQQYGTGR